MKQSNGSTMIQFNENHYFHLTYKNNLIFFHLCDNEQHELYPYYFLSMLSDIHLIGGIGGIIDIDKTRGNRLFIDGWI